jgi:hypothetical protein
MAENEFYKIDKLIPYKTKPQAKTYIKDGEIQVNMPSTRETSNTAAFHNIYSHYMEGAGKATHENLSGKIQGSDELKMAVDDWEKTFDEMMKISNHLEAACKEVHDMLSSG